MSLCSFARVLMYVLWDVRKPNKVPPVCLLIWWTGPSLLIFVAWRDPGTAFRMVPPTGMVLPPLAHKHQFGIHSCIAQLKVEKYACEWETCDPWLLRKVSFSFKNVLTPWRSRNWPACYVGINVDISPLCILLAGKKFPFSLLGDKILQGIRSRDKNYLKRGNKS